MKLAVIAAVAENGVIGRGGELPWHLSADLKRFKALTTGRTVIVGRKTFESIVRRLGHPLRDRRTIVVSRQEDYAADPCDSRPVAHSLDEAVQFCEGEGLAFVIGGAELYREAIPRADLLYVTRVHGNPEGDTFFPDVDWSCWELFVTEPQQRAQGDTHAYTFEVYRRKEQSFVELDNARSEDQRAVMEDIARDGRCPFCPDGEHLSELQPVIYHGIYWTVRRNRWPYNNTRVHLLLILNRHVEKLSDLSDGAALELFMICAEQERRHLVAGGAVCMRFGEPSKNGATVRHLHAHFIVANVTDRQHPDYKPVRFRVG